MSAEVNEQWRHNRNCLRACRVLAQSRIWTTKQLRNPQGTWFLRDELSRRHCSLTVEEYTSLTSWLSAANSSPEIASTSDSPAPSQLSNDRANRQSMVCTAYYGVLPPCIRGRLVEQPAGLGAHGLEDRFGEAAARLSGADRLRAVGGDHRDGGQGVSVLFVILGHGFLSSAGRVGEVVVVRRR